mgnify:CR=1 FL=1
MPEQDADIESTSPTWISFADLMTGLLGAFVLLLVALVVAIVFISVVAQIDLALMVVPLFVLAMVCLMVAVLLFLREVQLATAQLRRSF